MIILFIALGILLYSAALICTIKKSDWKPRVFLNLYSDLFFLTASIIAKSRVFIIVFVICCLYSLIKVIAYSKTYMNQLKKEKKKKNNKEKP